MIFFYYNNEHTYDHATEAGPHAVTFELICFDRFDYNNDHDYDATEHKFYIAKLSFGLFTM